jgi:hypothetical protein
MYALWAALPSEAARAKSEHLLRSAARRTTRVSGAWLAAAARGEAAVAWHRLVAALAEPTDDGLAPALHGVLRTGHTSGEDALIGFLGAVENLASFSRTQPGDALRRARRVQSSEASESP